MAERDSFAGFNDGMILPDLKTQLKSILDQYPDDGQILKELIQNAEDAGATEVTFLHDKGSFGQNTLYKKELGQYQGAALYAGNNAEFSKEDWTGIRMLNDSVKKDDPLKVGRFGLGFKSVYHMTDLPSLISGEHFAFFDPHSVYFQKNDMEMTSTFRKKLTLADCAKYHDQFAPFKVPLFDVSSETFKRGKYPRTLFRFPLRQHGSQSIISKTVYDDDKVETLFDSFKNDAHMVLMFLKNVQSVKLYEKGSIKKTPQLKFQVNISQECLKDVHNKRSLFNRKLKEKVKTSVSYQLTIETVDYECCSNPKSESSTWFITQVYDPTRGPEDETSLTVKRLPLAGIAVPLHSTPIGVHGIARDKETVTVKGHVFCFLPLPLPSSGESMTGLPFHVNAYFAVDQNRRHIKEPSFGSNSGKLGDSDLEWNECLIKKLLPMALFDNIESLSNDVNQGAYEGELNPFYSILKDTESINLKWRDVITNLPKELNNLRIFNTQKRKQNWLASQDVIFNTLQNQSVKSQDLIIQILAEEDVAHVPESFLKFWSVFTDNLKYITPKLVSQCFRKVQQSLEFSTEETLEIIRYIGVSDDIIGLQGLPLANGKIVKFTQKPLDCKDFVFIAKDPDQEKNLKVLLPLGQSHFSDQNLEAEDVNLLKEIASEGKTQLQFLEVSSVETLLPIVFPQDWKSSVIVSWDPKSSPLNESWFRDVWQFLLLHHNFISLERFEGLYIIPDFNLKKIVKMSKENPIVLERRTTNLHGNVLPKDIASVLAKLKCTILSSVPSYVEDHPRVNEYIYSHLDANTLLKIMQILSTNNSTEFSGNFQKLDRDERKKVTDFLGSLSVSVDCTFLKTLPLFELKTRGNNQPINVTLQQCSRGYPDLKALTLLSGVRTEADFLDLSTEASRRLAEKCSVYKISFQDFLRDHIFIAIKGNFYSPKEVEEIMKNFVNKIQFLKSEFPQLIHEIGSLCFVSDSSQKLNPPKDLYDPTEQNGILKNIFRDDTKFPSQSWTKLIGPLREVGLKGAKYVTPVEVVRVAKEIEKEEIESLSDTLLTFLGMFPQILSLDLKHIAWMLSNGERLENYPETLAWKGENDKFVKPSVCKCERFANIAGSAVNIVQVPPTCPQMGKFFEWDKEPEPVVVLEHFKNITASYTSEEKPEYLRMIKEVYQYLQSHHSEQVLQELKSMEEWVWHGDGFASISSVVISLPPLDMKPYIHQLPIEIKAFEGLFVKCGMQEICCYDHVLQQIKNFHDSQKEGNEQRAERDLGIAVSVLNKIKESDDDDAPRGLLIPIQSKDTKKLKLVPIQDCVYCDVDWFGKGGCLDIDLGKEELNYLHPNVPLRTAEKLGIPSLSNHILAPEFIDMSYGQQEKLTKRLHDLTKQYKDGFAVPKELIQNADDAGATEVKFLFDERENKDAMSLLMDKRMERCQGPALWAYNDACFTENDFKNLVKIGEESKKNQTNKIGKFGYGFNAVYNLTDVPSLVSGQHMVIFDPHTTHLGGMIKNPAKPGIKLNMNERKQMLSVYKDQFKPYNGVFDCDLSPGDSVHYDGTLFRFPLRTKSQAAESEIKNLHYSREEVIKLINLLLKGSDTLLLFSQNVKRVTVFHLGPERTNSSEMKELFCLQKETVKILRELGLQKRGYETKFLEIATEALKNKENTGDVKTSVIHEICIDVTKYGQGLLRTDHESSSRKQWLITCAMGTNESLNIARENESFVPVGGVAVEIQKVRKQYIPKESNGQLFCFLPLPTTTGMPFHLNGYFASTSNRKELCQRSSDDKDNSEEIKWNESLLGDAISNAFVCLLEDLSKNCDLEKYSFHSLWPRGSNLHQGTQILDHFTKSVYTKIARDQELCVFSDGREWFSIKKSIFLEPTLQDSFVGPIALKVYRDVLRQSDVAAAVVELPTEIRKNFEKYKLGEIIDGGTKKTYDFFKNVVMTNITDIGKRERNLLIQYALLLEYDEKLDQLLKESFCIETTVTNKSQLKKPTQLIHQNGKPSSLYTREDERFPEICSSANIDRKRVLECLERVGMIKDNLPWQDVLERSRTVKQLPHNTCRQRSKELLKYVGWKINMKTISESERNELCESQFLCLAEKPKDFPMEWKGDTYKIKVLSPKEVYSCNKIALIGSVCPVVDLAESQQNSKKTESLEEFLQLKSKNVNLMDVIRQLKLITQLTVTEQNKDWIRITCKKIYQYLSEQCRCQNAKKTISLELSDKNCIFLYDAFVHPKQCANKMQFSAEPYLYKIPFSMEKLQDLLEAVGVQDCISPEKMIEVLYEIQHIGKLTNPQITMVVDILIAFVENCPTSETQKEILTETRPLLIPDSNAVMRNADEVCYNHDFEDWLTPEDDLSFTHGQVSKDLAKKLNLKTVRDDVVNRCSFGMPFGQKEELTTRIQGLLADYPCGVEIFKELLQNADDAEASEICFVLDPWTHPAQKVLSDSWDELQGPSLLVCNNKSFKESDLIGIQKLGEGSKGSDATKTGQFGVGFNCVYHLTDVPSFLTKVEGEGKQKGKQLCVFDPGCQYAKGANDSTPGRRYMYDRTKRQFPDTFTPYLEDHFNIDSWTILRLPLRTKKSKICEKVVNSAFIRGLFEDFKAEVLDSLLFLNHLRKVGLYEVDTRGQLKIVYESWSELSSEDQKCNTNLAAKIKSCIGNVQQSGDKLSRIPYQDITIMMTTQDSNGLKKEWAITKCMGFENENLVPPSVKNAYNWAELRLFPKGGIAFPLNLDDRRSQPSQSYSQKTIRDAERHGKMYCFLPLAVTTNLPVYVNGHFALFKNRTDLCTDGGQGFTRDWNHLLFRDTLARAYVCLIEYLTTMVDKETIDINQYKDIFPSRDPEGTYYETFIKALYTIMAEEGRKVLPVLRSKKIEWYSSNEDKPRDAYFYDDGKAPWQILLQLGFNLIHKQLKVVHRKFKRYQITSQIVTPEIVLDFLLEYKNNESKCVIKQIKLPVSLQKTTFISMEEVIDLLYFCCEAEGFHQRLEGLPLALRNDSSLDVFSCENPLFMTYHTSLLPIKFHHLFGHDDTVKCFREANSPCVKIFTVEDLAKLLPEFLEQKYNTKDQIVEYDINNTRLVLPNNIWLQKLWRFLNSSTDRKHLEPLMNWTLLPCVKLNNKGKKKHFLFPLQKSASIVDTDSGDESSQALRTILKKTAFPELYIDAIGSDNVRMPKSLVGNINKPLQLITAFQDLMEEKQLQDKLGKLEAFDILRYFENNLQQIMDASNTQSLKQTLRQLPFYLSTNDKLVSLAEKTAYILPNDVPLDGLDVLHTYSDSSVLLKQDDTFEKLYRFLGCIQEELNSFYRKAVFPWFHNLPVEAQVKHFGHIHENGALDVFVTQDLKRLPFVKGRNKTNVTMDQCFDPLNDVFGIFEKDQLLPDEWIKWLKKEHWLKQFLIKIGLQSCPDDNKIIEYATRVEEEAKRDITEETVNKSDILVKCIMGRDWGIQILNRIKSIRFLPTKIVENEKLKIHPQYENNGREIRFICFEGSALPTVTEDLCWTSIPILGCKFFEQKQWTNKQATILKGLGVKSESLELVADHLTNVCNKVKSEMELNIARKRKLQQNVDHTSLMSVLETNFQFLLDHLEPPRKKQRIDNVKESTDEEEIDEQAPPRKKLKLVPLIPVDDGKMLVRAEQIAVKAQEENEIKPYMYVMPTILGKYFKLFQLLGATDEFTIQQYANVLKEIHSCTNGEKLKDPNMKKKVISATNGLYKLVLKGKPSDGVESFVGVEKLYLLCNDETLEDSTGIFYLDNEGWRKRLSGFKDKMLADFSSDGLKPEEIHKCIKKMPPNLKLKLLSGEIQEKLEGCSKPVHSGRRGTAALIVKQLHADDFIQGIQRIINHQLQEQIDNIEEIKQKLDELNKIIHQIRIIEVSNLETFLVKGSQSQRIPDSSEKTDCFADCTGNNVWTIYLDCDVEGEMGEEQQKKNIYCQVTEVLDNVTKTIFEKKCITEKLHLVKDIFTLTPSEISSFLDKMKISVFGSRPEKQKYMPEIGSFVPQDLHSLLQQDFDDFEIGEIVAYEVEDNVLDSTNEAWNSAVYIYAQVKSESNPKSENVSMLERMYSIEIGSGKVISVRSLLLYKFCTISLGHEGKELVLYQGRGKTHKKVKQDIKTVCEEISDLLEEAWKLPEKEKKAVIKRLYLKWHPDKNHGDEEFATEVFKHIKNELQRLEEGRPRLDKETYNRGGSTHGRTSQKTYTRRSNFSGFYWSDYFERMNKRARGYQQDQEQYQEQYQRTYSERYSDTNSQPNSGVPPESFQTSNPQPQEARRWLRQAEFDFKAAPSDKKSANEWVCFKCHQAAEKAIKGAKYAKDSWGKWTHDIDGIARGLDDASILDKARQLQMLLKSSTKMRYPDQHAFPSIPHDVYTEDDAKEALNLTQQIIDSCTSYIQDRS